MRFWASWYSDNEYWPTVPDVGNIENPIWCSGYDGEDHPIYCAIIEAEDEDSAYEVIYAADSGFFDERFMESTEDDWLPNDRFPVRYISDNLNWKGIKNV